MLATGGVLCKNLGWPSLFYLPGICSGVWILAWLLLMFDSPQVHPRISQEERDYLVQSLQLQEKPTGGKGHTKGKGGKALLKDQDQDHGDAGNDAREGGAGNAREGDMGNAREGGAGNGHEGAAVDGHEKGTEGAARDGPVGGAEGPEEMEAIERLKFPILDVLMSPAVWALWICHICFDWGAYAFFTTIPTFMKQVLFFDIEKNGLLSAVPYLLLWILITVTGLVVDYVLGRKWVTIFWARKILSGTGMIAPALILLLLWFTDCTMPTMAVVIFTFGVALTGLNFSGFIVNYMDIATKYTGILFAIANTTSSLAVYAAPTVFGWITKSKTHTSWALAYSLTSLILAIGGVVFVAFSAGEEQPWARGETWLQKRKRAPAEKQVHMEAAYHVGAGEGNEEQTNEKVKLNV